MTRAVAAPAWFGTIPSRECGICHRIGIRAFVPYGSEGWRCLHEEPCENRAAKRTRTEHDLTVADYGHLGVFVFGTRDHRLALAALPPEGHRSAHKASACDALWVWNPSRADGSGRWFRSSDTDPLPDARPGVLFQPSSPS